MPDEINKTKVNQYKTWVFIRKVIQAVILIGFLLIFILTQNKDVSANIINAIMRLDPLTGLANLLSSRVFLTGSSLALLSILLAILFGRAWCGWLCPLGTLLDLFSIKKSWFNFRKFPESWHKTKYGILFLILFAALLGNLTLLILDPLTILYRSLSVSFYPALDRIVTATESFLYLYAFLQNPLTVLDTWLRSFLLPAQPFFFRNTVIFALVFIGVISLNLIAPRFWCRYICPLGGLLALISKLSIFRRKVTPDCISCGLCEKECPTGAISAKQSYASDPGECTLCMDCLTKCPANSIRITPDFKPEQWKDHDPSRRQALITLGTAIAGIALFNSDWLVRRPQPFLLMPPGTAGTDFQSRCIRCELCVRSCPTGAIQPAGGESGVDGTWTPILVPRIGYCDYACNSCGQVCPVQAIPPLSLDIKQQQVIGKAYINKNRCLAWSDNLDCIVCEEMCPLPDKAIKLEQTEVVKPDGSNKTIKLPHVNREVCIGCGICEYKCPVNGESAIRVYITTNTTGIIFAAKDNSNNI